MSPSNADKVSWWLAKQYVRLRHLARRLILRAAIGLLLLLFLGAFLVRSGFHLADWLFL